MISDPERARGRGGRRRIVGAERRRGGEELEERWEEAAAAVAVKEEVAEAGERKWEGGEKDRTEVSRQCRTTFHRIVQLLVRSMMLLPR